MARHILYCPSTKTYTLSETCSDGTAAISRKPPKFSVEDKYGKYRRTVKRSGLEKEGKL